jgi:nucleoside-diphosphate-sugar epimerase
MEKLDVSSAWGRIFFLYGPGEPPKKLLASVILSLLQGQKAECSHGRQIRDFMYVKDIASAFVALLESNVTGPVNIASGKPITLKDLVSTVGKILGKEDDIIFGAKQAPPNEPPEITASVERLQKEVGWKPKYTHEEALKETIEWWREHQ